MGAPVNALLSPVGPGGATRALVPAGGGHGWNQQWVPRCHSWALGCYSESRCPPSSRGVPGGSRGAGRGASPPPPPGGRSPICP